MLDICIQSFVSKTIYDQTISSAWSYILNSSYSLYNVLLTTETTYAAIDIKTKLGI